MFQNHADMREQSLQGMLNDIFNEFESYSMI